MTTIEAPFHLDLDSSPLTVSSQLRADAWPRWALQMHGAADSSERMTEKSSYRALPVPFEIDSVEARADEGGHPEQIRGLIRQNYRLAFLNSLLSRMAGCHEVQDILGHLSRVFMDFSLQADLAAILWDSSEGHSIRAEAFVPGQACENSASRIDDLLHAGQGLLGERLAMTCVNTFDHCSDPAPGTDAPVRLTLPLVHNGPPFGVLLLDLPAGIRPVMDLGLLSSIVQQLSPQLSGAVAVGRLKRLADYDQLTGLPNRGHFDRRLAEEVKRHRRQSSPLSLIMLDLDDFKEINDSFGHQAGDDMLRQLGRLIQCSVRETDVAARYGGEEFTILLPDTTEPDARVLAERLQAMNDSRAESAQETSRHFTFSLGIASIEQDELCTGHELVRRADQALYSAKDNGKNTCRLFSKIAAHS